MSRFPDVSTPNIFDCAYDDEWSAWLGKWERARTTRRATDDPLTDFCIDCLPQFQAEMVAQGRCIRQSRNVSESEGAAEGISRLYRPPDLLPQVSEESALV